MQQKLFSVFCRYIYNFKCNSSLFRLINPSGCTYVIQEVVSKLNLEKDVIFMKKNLQALKTPPLNCRSLKKELEKKFPPPPLDFFLRTPMFTCYTKFKKLFFSNCLNSKVKIFTH